MSKVSRRLFMTGIAAIPFSLWLKNNVRAQTGLVRYDATSSQGQAMLKIYADAVTKMRDKNLYQEGDPRSWLFQWYTHSPPSSSKSAEIKRIYTNQSDPNRLLAEQMWETCQAHGSNDDENFFLPWHRMYVYFFERIVRKVSGNASFTLPYWNYSVSGPLHGVMPPEFRMPTDQVFSSLFMKIRNDGVNEGQPIDKNRPSDYLSLDALDQCTYAPNGAEPGFCMKLDFPLHGRIHVLVGKVNNMGDVPTAANDPVFWIHHCNIDRLWESWNKAGRKNLTNPNFLSKSFIFADENGTRVEAKVRDFLDVAKLGYSYDKLETPSKPCAPTISQKMFQMRAKTQAAASIRLGSTPVQVTLDLSAQANKSAPANFATTLKAMKSQSRIYLIVRNLSADAQPGIPYDIYLDLPADIPIEKRDVHLVGSIHFFDAVNHGTGGAAHGGMNMPQGVSNKSNKFFSFDITNIAKNLERNKLLNAKPVLTIAPAGQPVESANPLIGEITVVEQ